MVENGKEDENSATAIRRRLCSFQSSFASLVGKDLMDCHFKAHYKMLNDAGHAVDASKPSEEHYKYLEKMARNPSFKPSLTESYMRGHNETNYRGRVKAAYDSGQTDATPPRQATRYGNERTRYRKRNTASSGYKLSQAHEVMWSWTEEQTALKFLGQWQRAATVKKGWTDSGPPEKAMQYREFRRSFKKPVMLNFPTPKDLYQPEYIKRKRKRDARKVQGTQTVRPLGTKVAPFHGAAPSHGRRSQSRPNTTVEKVPGLTQPKGTGLIPRPYTTEPIEQAQRSLEKTPRRSSVASHISSVPSALPEEAKVDAGPEEFFDVPYHRGVDASGAQNETAKEVAMKAWVCSKTKNVIWSKEVCLPPNETAKPAHVGLEAGAPKPEQPRSMLALDPEAAANKSRKQFPLHGLWQIDGERPPTAELLPSRRSKPMVAGELLHPRRADTPEAPGKRTSFSIIGADGRPCSRGAEVRPGSSSELRPGSRGSIYDSRPGSRGAPTRFATEVDYSSRPSSRQASRPGSRARSVIPKESGLGMCEPPAGMRGLPGDDDDDDEFDYHHHTVRLDGLYEQEGETDQQDGEEGEELEEEARGAEEEECKEEEDYNEDDTFEEEDDEDRDAALDTVSVEDGANR